MSILSCRMSCRMPHVTASTSLKCVDIFNMHRHISECIDILKMRLHMNKYEKYETSMKQV